MIALVGTVLHQKLNEKLQKRGIPIARNIAQASTGPLLMEQYFELELLFHEFMRAEEEIAYIFLITNRGDIAAHTFEEGFPIALKYANIPVAGEEMRVAQIETENKNYFDIAMPLLKGSIGIVHVGLQKDSVMRDLREVILLMTWLIAAVLVVASGIAIAASAAITRPILELVSATVALERGDLNARVPVRAATRLDCWVGHSTA